MDGKSSTLRKDYENVQAVGFIDTTGKDGRFGIGGGAGVMKAAPGMGGGTHVRHDFRRQLALPTGWMLQPNSVAVDTAGNVYVGDAGNGRVQVFQHVGGSYNFQLKFGGFGTAPGMFEVDCRCNG